MHKFLDLIPFSKVGFHIKLACFLLFMLIFLPCLRLSLYFCDLAWLQKLWPIEINLGDTVEVYQLSIISYFFVFIVALIEICTIKRKYWAYIANLILSVALLMGALLSDFASMQTVLYVYPLFVLTQKSTGEFFSRTSASKGME